MPPRQLVIPLPPVNRKATNQLFSAANSIQESNSCIEEVRILSQCRGPRSRAVQVVWSIWFLPHSLSRPCPPTDHLITYSFLLASGLVSLRLQVSLAGLPYSQLQFFYCPTLTHTRQSRGKSLRWSHDIRKRGYNTKQGRSAAQEIIKAIPAGHASRNGLPFSQTGTCERISETVLTHHPPSSKDLFGSTRLA